MGYIIYNGTIVTGEGEFNGIIITDGKYITDILKEDNDQKISFEGKLYDTRELVKKLTGDNCSLTGIDANGKHIFAGGIDTHVHFREPGLTQKADMESESKAALLGGVTSFVDMPNTNPPTISAERIKDKTERAEGRCWANYGFHLGATNSNFDEINSIIRGTGNISAEDFGGVKVFMGSSTGNMLVDDESSLSALFSIKEKPVLVHCEDENTIRENTLLAQEKYGENIPFSAHRDIRSRRACILSSIKALETAIQKGTRLHLLHVSTMEEVQMIRAAKMSNMKITAETSANYLWFCDKDYDRLGSRVKCNPSVKTEKDRAALREALKEGIIDSIGSDHAPHLLSEKEGNYLKTPSGLPSIQQTLSVLLTVAKEDDIPLSRIAAAFSENPARILGIRERGYLKKGYRADIVITDTEQSYHIGKDNVSYKCGWSPYEGAAMTGKVESVIINGKMEVSGGKLIEGAAPEGEKLVF